MCVNKMSRLQTSASENNDGTPKGLAGTLIHRLVLLYFPPPLIGAVILRRRNLKYTL